MKYIYASIAGVVVATWGIFWHYNKGPVCIEANKVLDFGSVPSGCKAVRHTQIRNEGSQDLHILSVAPGCGGCLDVMLDKKIVSPGENAVLSATVVPELFGLQTSGVLLRTNDRQRPNVVIRTIYKLSKNISIEPSKIDFGDLQATSLPKYYKLRLNNISYRSPANDGGRLFARANASFISTSVKPADDYDGTEVIVKLTENWPFGTLYQPLKIGYEKANQHLELMDEVMYVDGL